MPTILEVIDLVKIFDNKVAVNKVNFEVEKNSVFGLLGPNGSGKTTTLRLILTSLTPNSGSIRINDFPYNGKHEHKIKHIIGYVPQKDALYPDLTIKENIDLFFSAYSYQGDRKKRIEEVVKLVNLTAEKDKLCRNLSGGMLKRASIACALVHKPEIILFDEVTVGLDPQSRYQIWDLVRMLKKDSTVIMTTHYMDEAEELCDEIIIMDNGNLYETGSPKELVLKHNAKDLNEAMLKISKQKCLK